MIASLRVLGSLLAREHEIADIIVDLGITSSLLIALSHPNFKIRKEAAWVTSNISAGTVKHINVLISCGTIEKIIELSTMDVFEVRQECMWALSNAVNWAKDNKVIEKLLEIGIIETFCSMLGCNEPQTLIIIMEGLKELLRYGKEHSVYLMS